MARRLKDMDIEEVSLVEAGAVRKKFYIKKRRDLMDLLEILKEVLGEDTELTDEEIAKIKALGEDNSKGITDALNLFKDYVDQFPPELAEALTALVKSACYGYPVEDPQEIDVLAEMLDVEKAKGWLDKATVAKLKKIIDTLTNMVTVKEGDFKKKTNVDPDKLSPEVVARLEKLDALEEAELKKEKDDKDKVITDLVESVKTMNDNITKLAKGKPISKQLKDEPDPDDDDNDPDPKTVLTKAQFQKLDKEARKIAVKEGRYDLFPSMSLISSQQKE